MLFTILYIVMSVNRYDTKLWLQLNSLDCFVQLKEKNVQISKFIQGFRLSYIWKMVETHI